MKQFIGEKASLKPGPGATETPVFSGGSIQTLGEKANLGTQPSGLQGLTGRNTGGGTLQSLGEKAKLSKDMGGNHGYQGTVMSKRTSERSK